MHRMLFNSYLFVFIFLPVSLLGFYLAADKICEKAAKIWLIAVSMWFYGNFAIEYLGVLLISAGFNFIICRGMMKARKTAVVRGILAGGICGNLFLLIYFKYMNFFIENINLASGNDLPLLSVILPVGISFYTFSQISFLVDNYRGEIKDCGPVNYLLYITYFPKLLQGPIAAHSEMLPQFERIGRTGFNGEQFVRGIGLFVFGMLKKVVLADTFGGAVDYGYSNLNIMHGWDAVLLVLFYSLQLYFDFSGYCDMGRGVSRMFGIELPENFNSPYKGKNIIDFWKRWHITLNRFFVKYVYIPLGGSRAGAWRMYRNLLFVFLLSGLWHGAGWNFILWGMMHGILYVFTRMMQQRKASKGAGRLGTVISTLFTFIYVSIAWVYFRAGSCAQGNELLGLIFQNDFVKINRDLAGYFNLDEFWYILKLFRLDKWEYGHYILMFVITSFSLLLVFFGKNAAQTAAKMKLKAWNAIVIAGLFFWCILTFSKVSTFLYFNF